MEGESIVSNRVQADVKVGRNGDIGVVCRINRDAAYPSASRSQCAVLN